MKFAHINLGGYVGVVYVGEHYAATRALVFLERNGYMNIYLLLTLIAIFIGLPGAWLSVLLLKDRWKGKESKPH